MLEVGTELGSLIFLELSHYVELLLEDCFHTLTVVFLKSHQLLEGTGQLLVVN
jgi:hypothetical protein